MEDLRPSPTRNAAIKTSGPGNVGLGQHYIALQ